MGSKHTGGAVCIGFATQAKLAPFASALSPLVLIQVTLPCILYGFLVEPHPTPIPASMDGSSCFCCLGIAPRGQMLKMSAWLLQPDW